MVERPGTDPRVERPGWMLAIWPSVCRACGDWITERQVQALAEVPGRGPALGAR